MLCTTLYSVESLYNFFVVCMGEVTNFVLVRGGDKFCTCQGVTNFVLVRGGDKFVPFILYLSNHTSYHKNSNCNFVELAELNIFASGLILAKCSLVTKNS